MSAGCQGCAARPEAGPVGLTLTTRRDAGPPPWYHVVDGAPLVVLVEGSAVLEVEPSYADLLRAGDAAAVAELRASPAPELRGLDRLDSLPRPRAVSLTVAQACNLACDYCYADEGRFHAPPRLMSREVAFRAVDDIVGDAAPGEHVTVGFMGGEPFLNREVLHETVAYAGRRAADAGVAIGFSVTTNGTLLDGDDVAMLRANRFAVTVSLDGGPELHDRHRPTHSGAGTWHDAVAALRPLLSDPGRARLSARATVTRDDLDVAGRVAALTAAGFTDVGVSPVRSSPDPSLALRGDDWAAFLDAMVAAADHEVDRVRRDRAPALRFANLVSALREIARGTCRPLPCGSAYGYVSVEVDGRYATCHRTVGDARFGLGTVGALDDAARRAFLGERLVDRQEPCRSCWARYLCGGGCHAEVAQVGRDGCDYVRGWLDHCLRLYAVLDRELPDLLVTPAVEVIA